MADTFENWFDTQFWPTYKQYMKTPFPQKWKQGAKGEAYTKAKLRVKTLMERDQAMLALNAQIRHRKVLFSYCGSSNGNYLRYTKESGDPIYLNRQAKTWLHNYGWRDEVPDLPKKQSRVSPGTSMCECGKPASIVSGVPKPVCDICYSRKYSDAARKLDDNLASHGLERYEDESLKDFARRCKNWCIENGFIISRPK